MQSNVTWAYEPQWSQNYAKRTFQMPLHADIIFIRNNASLDLERLVEF